MGSLNRNFARIGAVLAVSSFALVGCSANSAPVEPTPTQTEQLEQTRLPSQASAASFANEFFAALIEEDTSDYSKLTPPIELTEAQAEQLMLDGKVDGVSEEELNGLVDFLYAEHKLGGYVYFDEAATAQERLQTISALIMAQSFASSVSTDQAPTKVLAEDVAVSELEDKIVASFAATNEGALAPTLIFVDGEWKVDGLALLESVTGPAEAEEAGSTAEPTAPATPETEAAPSE